MDEQWPEEQTNPYASSSGPPPLPPSGGPPPLPAPTPWNGWWTLLWGVVALSVWMGIQTVLTLLYMLFLGAFQSTIRLQEVAEGLMHDGDFLGIATLASALLTCPVCYYLGKFRKGFTGAGYLGLNRLPLLPLVFWLGVTAMVGMLFNFCAPVIGAEETPDFMVKAAESAKVPLLLILGVVVGAPLVEEFIFRGLLFRGWRESQMGLAGTLLVTSAVFSAMHLQYLAHGVATAVLAMTWIFVLSLILGYARHRTGSLWVPIAMHALNNGIATVEVYRYIG